jgi:hypothetical protein
MQPRSMFIHLSVISIPCALEEWFLYTEYNSFFVE